MRELQLIVPGLASWRDSPHHERIAMPGLDKLLARGRPLSCEASLAGALCAAFGLPRHGPLAYATATLDGLDAEDGYWLRADPVHLQVGMRGLTLLDAGHVGLSMEESKELAASLLPLFKEAGWRLYAPAPGRWYAHPAQALELRTTPLDQVTTHHVNSALPQGEDAACAMRLVNEAQILLHEHPANLARERHGQAAINSLWLWGGGEKAKATRRYDLVLGGQVEARALAQLSGSPHAPCPAKLTELPRVKTALLQLPEFPADAALTQAAQLDADWFLPLLRTLSLGRIRHVRLTLTGPEGNGVDIGMTDAWKFWN